MKVKILLSIGYVILFAVLGFACASPTPPSKLAIAGLFALFSACFAYTWLGDTVSKEQK